MKSIKVKITDPIGIHARPASKITNIASKYKSDVIFRTESGRIANAKSIINLMALGVKANNKIEIETKGIDEQSAIQDIERIMREVKLID